MALTKKMRQHVWNKSGGMCWYCGCDLPKKGWHADHFEPIGREYKYETKKLDNGMYRRVPVQQGISRPHLDRLKNTVPACAPCNLFKSVWTVEGFRQEIEAQIERCRKTSANFRTAERFGLIQANETNVVFWFEKQPWSIGVDE